MKIDQIYTGCLAQGAYFISSDGVAAVVDPLRETAPYLEKAEKEGVRIKYILETHFHADFVSGHIDLAEKTGAKIVYGPNAETNYNIHSANDGEILPLGKLKIKVLHTPGHTLESTCYLLLDEEGKEHAIFTGDTLFIGDVGRPDLAQKEGEFSEKDLAGMLYDSLREKIMPLPDNVLVYPAHGAGSACGKNMSKETWDTLGHQKQVNYALRESMSKKEFIEEVLDGILPPPVYFAQNARLNKQGYESIQTVMERGLNPLSVEEFDYLIEKGDTVIIDTRKPHFFVNGFIPGSLFIGLDGQFAPWVGTLIPDVNQKIAIVCERGKEKEVIQRLARVGYDNCLGYLNGGIDAWINSERKTDKLTSISALDFESIAAMEKLNILDVRKPGEYNSEHLSEAVNMPLDYINENIDNLDSEKEYYIHCAGGYRSVIFASILKANGFEKLIDIAGGFAAIKGTNLPMLANACSN